MDLFCSCFSSPKFHFFFINFKLMLVGPNLDFVDSLACPDCPSPSSSAPSSAYTPPAQNGCRYFKDPKMVVRKKPATSHTFFNWPRSEL